MVPQQSLPFSTSESVRDRYTIDQLVSENHGLRSKVYKGTFLGNGAPVAIKEVAYNPSNQRSLQVAKLEIGVLYKVARTTDNPSLVRRIEAFWDQASHKFFLVLPWYDGETLFERIVHGDGRRMPERSAQRVFAQLVSAVRDLHAAGIVHRDIKPANVLMAHVAPTQVTAGDDGASHDVAVLSDFGLASAAGLYDTFHGQRVGTLEYMPPEMMEPHPMSSPVGDIWSLGVVLYNMLSGTPPFNPTKGDVTEDIRRARFMIPRRFFRGVSTEAKQVLQLCMRLDQSARPTADELYSHPWVQEGAADMQPHLPVVSVEGAASPVREPVAAPAPAPAPVDAEARNNGGDAAAGMPTSLSSDEAMTAASTSGASVGASGHSVNMSDSKHVGDVDFAMAAVQRARASAASHLAKLHAKAGAGAGAGAAADHGALPTSSHDGGLAHSNSSGSTPRAPARAQSQESIGFKLSLLSLQMNQSSLPDPDQEQLVARASGQTRGSRDQQQEDALSRYAAAV